jgi:hypothetical protein
LIAFALASQPPQTIALQLRFDPSALSPSRSKSYTYFSRFEPPPPPHSNLHRKWILKFEIDGHPMELLASSGDHHERTFDDDVKDWARRK